MNLPPYNKAHAELLELFTYLDHIGDDCKGDNCREVDNTGKVVMSNKMEFIHLAKRYLSALGKLLGFPVSITVCAAGPLSHADVIAEFGDTFEIWLGSDITANSNRVPHGTFGSVTNKTLFRALPTGENQWINARKWLTNPMHFPLTLAKQWKPELVPFFTPRAIIAPPKPNPRKCLLTLPPIFRSIKTDG